MEDEVKEGSTAMSFRESSVARKVLKSQVLTPDERDEAVSSFVSHPSHLALLDIIATFNVQRDTPGHNIILKVKEAVGDLSPLLEKGLTRWPQEFAKSVRVIFSDTLPTILSILHDQPAFQHFVPTAEQDHLVQKVESFVHSIDNQGKVSSVEGWDYGGPLKKLQTELKTHMLGQSQKKMHDDYIAKIELLGAAAERMVKEAEQKKNQKAEQALLRLQDEAKTSNDLVLLKVKQLVADAARVGGTYMLDKVADGLAKDLLLKCKEVEASIKAMDEVRRYGSVCQLTNAWANALIKLTASLKECASTALAKQRTSDLQLASKLDGLEKALLVELSGGNKVGSKNKRGMEHDLELSGEERSVTKVKTSTCKHQ